MQQGVCPQATGGTVYSLSGIPVMSQAVLTAVLHNAHCTFRQAVFTQVSDINESFFFISSFSKL